MDNISQDRGFAEFKELINTLQDRYSVNLIQLFELLSEKEIYVPLSVFNETTSALETVVKYLHENLNITFVKIAQMLNRSEKTIWQAYRHSKKKHKGGFNVERSRYIVPVKIFTDRKFSNLEALVMYLRRKYDLRFSEIAALLHRDQRTIWTVNARAKKKI